METRRNHDYINDQAKSQQSRTEDGYLKAKHANNDTRADDDYLKPKPNTRPDNGYLELETLTDETRPDDDYVEIGHMNNQIIGNSGQYDIIDYNLLRKEGPRHNQHIHRGDHKVDAKERTRQVPQRQHRSETAEIPITADSKKGGHRVFILIIVLLVVLLVAMAATFGVLYTDGVFDKDGPSGTETSISTTPATTTIAATTTTEPLSIEERCQSYSGLIPHPSECQAYYNCSDTKVLPPLTNFEPFLNECPYPQLFNIETMTCEHFENVECGERLEAKDGCDYRAIKCDRQPCMSCGLRYPACKGKKDGLNMHDMKPWTQYYIICYKERFVKELSCQFDPVPKWPMWFSPEYDGCVALDRIPWEHNGYKPNCTGKEDGRYPNNYGRCSYYVLCAFGQYVGYVVCPEGMAFDEVTETCTETPYTYECENNRW